MKYFFSLVIFLKLTSSLARPFILVSYKSMQGHKALLIEKVLKERFKLPPSYYLFEINNNSCISEVRPKAAHLCILEDEEIKIIFRNKYVLERTLGIYWK